MFCPMQARRQGNGDPGLSQRRPSCPQARSRPPILDAASPAPQPAPVDGGRFRHLWSLAPSPSP
jgi:hypothetical protein